MPAALIRLPEPDLPAVAGPERDAARAFADAALAPSTRKGYRSDFAIFAAWCRVRGFMPLPAMPEVLAMFLSSQAHEGVRVSTIGCRIAAIAYAHKLAGHAPAPTASEIVRTVMRGIRRSVGTAPRRASPATADVITDMLRHCPGDTLRGKRDRALLLLGFAAALRRSELVALQVTDLSETEDGLRVLIRRSKTDQEGQGATVAVPRGRRLRPVAAVRLWLDAAEITEGPVFRPVGGRVQPEALTDRSVADIVKRLAEQAGYDPVLFSGHSLRSGFLTSAAANRASVWKMHAVSRHKSLDVLSGYVRDAEAFDDHAVPLIGSGPGREPNHCFRSRSQGPIAASAAPAENGRDSDGRKFGTAAGGSLQE